MFLYIKNIYNPSPNIILESDVNDQVLRKNFLVKYLKSYFLELPTDIETFNKRFKKKFIYNIKREKKLLNQFLHDVEFNILTKRDDLGYFLPKVYDLFNERWKDEFTSSCWKKRHCFQKYADALTYLASNNEGFLAVIHNKENLLGYAYCLINKDNLSVHMYQHTVKRVKFPVSISIGKILIYDLIQYLINEKFRILDFMIGDSKYKIEWTKNNFQWTYLIIPKNVLGVFKVPVTKARFFFQYWKPSRVFFKKLFKILEDLNGRK